MLSNRRRVVGIGAVLVAIAALSHRALVAIPVAAPAVPIVWPKAPGRPLVRFVETISGSERGGRASLFRRFGRALIGGSGQAMVRPIAVAATEEGDDEVLWVADPGAQALHRLAGRERKWQVITKAGAERLLSPVGIAVGDRFVYVADSVLKRVLVFDHRGRFARAIGQDRLARPTGIVLDRQAGRLFVADTTAHDVVVFTEDGRLERRFGVRGRGEGAFNYPTQLALDGDGTLWVVDALNFRVQHFSADGRFLGAFGRQGDGSGDLASPKGIALDRESHLYVVDALFDTVQMFDGRGQLLVAFAERGVEAGQLWLPSGICVDARGRIYVADSYNRRVQVYELVGRAG